MIGFHNILFHYRHKFVCSKLIGIRVGIINRQSYRAQHYYNNRKNIIKN